IVLAGWMLYGPDHGNRVQINGNGWPVTAVAPRDQCRAHPGRPAARPAVTHGFELTSPMAAAVQRTAEGQSARVHGLAKMGWTLHPQPRRTAGSACPGHRVRGSPPPTSTPTCYAYLHCRGLASAAQPGRTRSRV